MKTFRKIAMECAELHDQCYRRWTLAVRLAQALAVVNAVGVVVMALVGNYLVGVLNLAAAVVAGLQAQSAKERRDDFCHEYLKVRDDALRSADRYGVL